MVPSFKTNISAKITRSSALQVFLSSVCIFLAYFHFHSLNVPPPESHLLPQERSGIPGLGMGNENLEQLQKLEKLEYFRQPSLHLGPQGYYVVLQRMRRFVIRRHQSWWLCVGCTKGWLPQVMHMVVVSSYELWANANPLFALACRKAQETTYAYLEYRNEIGYCKETSEMGPYDLCPQKTVLAHGICCTTQTSPSHPPTCTDRACI